MSSTALVLQLLTEQGVLNTRAGRNAFAVLLFQDLAVIPVLALLAAPHGGGLAMLRGVIAAAVVMVGGRYLLRPVLRLLAAAQVPEVFTAAALLIVVAVSLGMESIGLSESLGAFLAGVLLADSEYRHEMQADIEPFKSLLMGLFFIAIGMSADFTVVAREPAVILALVAGLVAIKALVLLAVALGNGLRGRAALTFGLALAQGGEFAFVLFDIAGGRGLLPPDLHARLVVAVTLSMLLTPPLLMLVKRLGVGASEAPPYDELKAPEAPVLIAGFGPFGQIVARVLRVRRIPFTVLEKDWQHVDFVRRFGGGVFYSDATRLEVLRAARIGSARALVVAIAERTTSEFIVERVRGQYPNLRIFAVARDRQHEIALRRLGADFVIRRHLLSGLALVEQLLVLLGDRPERAQHTVATFADHDARTLSQQMDLGDENARIQTALQSARELEELFAADEEDEARKRRADAA
jgi:Kef-type K+ transport systems, membrane components